MTQPSPTKDKNTPCHDDCEDTEKSDEHTKFLSDSVGSEWNILTGNLLLFKM